MAPVSFGKEIWNRKAPTNRLGACTKFVLPTSIFQFPRTLTLRGVGEECLTYGVDLGRILGFVSGKGYGLP